MADQVQLYSVEDCYLEIGGNKYPVSQFTLDLSENGIPTLSVGLDMHTATASSDVTVSPFDISEYFNWYKEAQALCDTRENKTSFYFKSIVKDASEAPQELTIANWVCVQPGFNRATASASSLSSGITLMHPAVNLDCAATHLFNPTMYTPNPNELKDQVDGAKDVLDLFIRCLKAYIKRTTAKNLSVQMKILYNNFVEMVDKITVYITFNATKKFPLSTGSSTDYLKTGIRYNMWGYAAQMAAENPWTLIKQIALDWFLTVVPAADFQKLTMIPLSPWQAASYTINIENISSVTLPSHPILPILGAYIVKDLPVYERINYAAKKKHSTIQVVEGENIYIEAATCNPKAAVATAPLGSFKRFAIPGWFEQGVIQFTGDSTIQPSGDNKQKDKDYPPSDKTLIEKKKKETVLKKGLQVICDQCYLMYYKSTSSVSVTGRLMINAPEGSKESGKMVPGKVVSITGTAGTLFSFYITNIVHNVNISTKRVETTINGRYLRGPTETTILYNNPNPLNPLYM